MESSEERAAVSIEAETKWSVPFAWGVLGAITLAILLAIACYATYRSHQIDAAAPVVQTCVSHRVTQRVTVTE